MFKPSFNLAFVFTLIGSQAFAFGADVTFPNLTWPTDSTPTQACIDPASLSSPECLVTR
jgi:hypothetical protein